MTNPSPKKNLNNGVVDKSVFLDANHSHFVMVDNSQLNVYGGEIKFRTKLEKAIVGYRKDASEVGEPTRNNESEAAPIVVLVLEGGPNTLETGSTANLLTY